MVRKTILVVFMLVLLVGTAFGECRVTRDTWMYLETDSFFAWARMARVNPEQAVAMLLQDGREGNAVFIPKGSRLSLKKRIDDVVSILELRGVPMIAMNDFLRCD